MADPTPDELDALAILRAEGLTPGLLAVAELLRSQTPNGRRRWEALELAELIQHLFDHAWVSASTPSAIDADSGHLNTAHTAARALMALTRLVR